MQAPAALPPAVSFPSDLAALAPGTLVRVAGKLVRSSPEVLDLADALRVCRAEFAGASPDVSPNLGEWVVVEGTLNATRDTLSSARLIAVHAGREQPRGQFRRLGRLAPNLVARSRAQAAVRDFFVSRGYLEVNTPVRVKAPGTDVYLEPQPSGDGWLITSPEFHLKRLLAGGMPRLFEFAHCTRRDEVGSWHQPEFTMLEWYALLSTFEDLLAETQALVLHVATALGTAPELTVNGRAVRLDAGFERLTVAEAFRDFAQIDDVVSLAAEDEDRYFQLMVDLVDPALAKLSRPVLLTHYPLSQAALSTPSADKPGFAERFELFIGGVELCNGYGELTCATTQRQRFEDDVRKRAARGLPAIPIDDGLLAALEEGLPPCVGNAVGFDRLLAVLLEQPLDRVVAFAADVAG